MSEHVGYIRDLIKSDIFRQCAELEVTADHLERCEKLLSAYYASHSDPKFGPCECEACGEYRKARTE